LRLCSIGEIPPRDRESLDTGVTRSLTTIRHRADPGPGLFVKSAGAPYAALLSLALKLVVGALPMRKFSAVRPALRDPDAIGAFADAIFVQPGGEIDCG
jgi:hypothetical protein